MQTFPDAFAAPPAFIPHLQQAQGIPPRKLIRFADVFVVRKVAVKTSDGYHDENFFFG